MSSETAAAVRERPKRIQRKRSKGWRLPENARCVTRPGVFGNPFVGADAVAAHAHWLECGKTAAEVVADAGRLGYDVRLAGERYGHRSGHAQREAAVARLKGFDLACACPVGSRCHADVLLNIANGRPMYAGLV